MPHIDGSMFLCFPQNLMWKSKFQSNESTMIVCMAMGCAFFQLGLMETAKTIVRTFQRLCWQPSPIAVSRQGENPSRVASMVRSTSSNVSIPIHKRPSGPGPQARSASKPLFTTYLCLKGASKHYSQIPFQNQREKQRNAVQGGSRRVELRQHGNHVSNQALEVVEASGGFRNCRCWVAGVKLLELAGFGFYISQASVGGLHPYSGVIRKQEVHVTCSASFALRILSFLRAFLCFRNLVFILGSLKLNKIIPI